MTDTKQSLKIATSSNRLAHTLFQTRHMQCYVIIFGTHAFMPETLSSIIICHIERNVNFFVVQIFNFKIFIRN